jgi:hypothetical protein
MAHAVDINDVAGPVLRDHRRGRFLRPNFPPQSRDSRRRKVAIRGRHARRAGATNCRFLAQLWGKLACFGRDNDELWRIGSRMLSVQFPRIQPAGTRLSRIHDDCGRVWSAAHSCIKTIRAVCSHQGRKEHGNRSHVDMRLGSLGARRWRGNSRDSQAWRHSQLRRGGRAAQLRLPRVTDVRGAAPRQPDVLLPCEVRQQPGRQDRR